MKIAINAGHFPGMDNGAVGDRLVEAEVNHEVMKMTADRLRKLGHEVLEIQENEIAETVKKSNLFPSDLFISLHCNASVDHAASGTEVHYQGADGGRLAGCIQRHIVCSMATHNRGCKKSENLYVLKHTDCPAVLVELAFITNREDEDLLIGSRMGFADAIARGVEEYIFIFCAIF